MGQPLPVASQVNIKSTAPPLLLAHAWDNDQDLTGWLLSEKLDGVRAYWDGTRFLSRQGNPFHSPPWFTAELPNIPLDGELWLGRKKFQRTVSIVRRQDGGEGLMLRQPGSRYESGRSSTLLKVKTFHDAEARVLEHLPGSGRHRGRLGALLVELPSGTQFSVGTGFTDAQRGDPPPVGSHITFRYQELTDGGVPRFPSFVRTRPDP